jgi:hypothetical protein
MLQVKDSQYVFRKLMHRCDSIQSGFALECKYKVQYREVHVCAALASSPMRSLFERQVLVHADDETTDMLRFIIPGTKFLYSGTWVLSTLSKIV